ncbi:MAG: PepSY-associated TM helix domain-containing protein, partial [Pseudoxanthomonas sp.]
LLFMGVTGTLLALEDMTSPTALQRRGSPSAERRTPPTAATLPTAGVNALLADTARLLAAEPRPGLVSVKLYMQGDAARVQIEQNGRPAQAFDLASGRPVAAPAAAGGEGAGPPLNIPAWRASAHGWLEYLHRGAFASWPGVIIVLLTGIALVALSVTGLTVYLDMFKRRRGSGRKGLFWR